MSKTIYVPDVNSLDAVVRAFQEALDAVINLANVEQLVKDRYRYHQSQDVDFSDTQPSVGCVSVLGERGSDNGVLFVQIYSAGRGGGPRVVYVPGTLAGRLVVALKGTAASTRLVRDTLNHEYRAVLRLPLRTFHKHPHAVITVQAS